MNEKNSDQRGQIPRMRDMTVAEQDIHIERWKLRNALRTAYNEIVGAMLLWIIDSPDIEAFVASGHLGLFHTIPSKDLLVRMTANGFTPEEVQDALDRDETPLNWMTPEELAAVVERIDLMKMYFARTDPGTFAQAFRIYQVLGAAARRNFIERYGYPPEQSPIPHVRISGTERERKNLMPDDHQPKLF